MSYFVLVWEDTRPGASWKSGYVCSGSIARSSKLSEARTWSTERGAKNAALAYEGWRANGFKVEVQEIA